MINIQDAIHVHEILIDKFGGAKGVRDLSLLESALSRPFQTFDQKDLYPTPIEKSAALIESILINHPFIDGNKRIGYVLMRLLLMD
jgi:death-on-curing protein